MKIIDMVMPQMGESIMECTVLGWLKQPGDSVEADDSILEVATDKVDTEVPSPYSGTLEEILVKEGDVVEIGATVARLRVNDEVVTGNHVESPTDTVHQEAVAHTDSEKSDNLDADTVEASENNDKALNLEEHMASFGLPTLRYGSKAVSSNPTPEHEQNNGFFSPLVLSIAREEGVSMEELLSIEGTGAESRVTKKDLLRFIGQKTESGPHVPPGTSSQPVTRVNGSVEIIEMDRMRRMIAQRMQDSKNISAHVTSFIETDMTTIVQWREQVKSTFRQQTGTSITYTPILIEAVIRAIKEFPLINVSVEGDKLLIKKSINIGMAVALPDGNLIVPVIHQADQYNLVGLAKKVNELAHKARENKLKPDDLAGGTYTVSNIGTFGNLMGTPIIVQPQVAIMAFGAIQKKPAVVETPQGDLLGIRQKMFISHSYDHRVVDGSLGGIFLKRVSDHLANFDPKRPIV
ncbi:dihydrolipoamide acetyltransferase family protein [Salmonirosea aquatica]|uniref:Dihydrolipoamide acetyltransferase component of pyruvate dehydrogenase complex n=1 Tax=Salmonirosea aquatica TaxID=2654236 RepID=A0A7C9BKN2_9BACT|nr:2-oxo acid dehydrogenase subunit E2 [Cytophagaceae bacterium SJW1-29]